MIKELFTGGPQVQRARQQITSLEHKDVLSKRDQRTLRQARTVTRGHFLKQLVLAAAGGTVLAVPAAHLLPALFGQGNDRSESAHSLLVGNTNPEASLNQQDLVELSRTAINIHNNLLYAEINPRVASEVKLVTDEETTKKEGFLLGKTKRNPDGSETIMIFKPVIDKLVEVTTVPPELKEELIRYIAKVAVVHELVHWTAIHDKATNFIKTLAMDIIPQNPQIATRLLSNGYVDGATIIITTSPEISTFSELEEAEAVLITDYLDKSVGISEALRNFLLEKKIEVSSPETRKRVEMYKDLFYRRLGFKSELDIIMYLVMIRKTLGGREEFCRLIAEKLEVDVEINGQKPPNSEIYVGLQILRAIDNTDDSRYKLFTAKEPQ